MEIAAGPPVLTVCRSAGLLTDRADSVVGRADEQSPVPESPFLHEPCLCVLQAVEFHKAVVGLHPDGGDLEIMEDVCHLLGGHPGGKVAHIEGVRRARDVRDISHQLRRSLVV